VIPSCQNGHPEAIQIHLNHLSIHRNATMTIAMDDKLARALALAMFHYPRANLQQLAQTAGTSKATLYRISPTRDGIVDMLTSRSIRHMQDALDDARLTVPPFAEALHRLTDNIMREQELYMFWGCAMWIDLKDDAKNFEQHGYQSSFFSDALEAFFLRGQKAGVFRIDMPARWLAKSYDFLLFSAIESAQRGEIAMLGISGLVQKMFMHGAATPPDEGGAGAA
jgi:TetR/AcrR family transcriptional regulator, mexCD-oprJ operon repressor